MGQVHNELRRTALSRALTRAVGDSRGEAGLERFGETLTPTIDLWSQPEWYHLRGVRLWGARAAQAAVVAEFSCIAVVNPAAGKRILVIDNARDQSAQICALRIATEAAVEATLAAVIDVISRDTRQPAITSIRCITGSDAGLLGNAIGEAVALATGGASFDVGLPAVLSPGFALVFEGLTLNTQLQVVFAGHDRLALPGELD